MEGRCTLPSSRVFVLSPASLSGARGRALLQADTRSALAGRLRSSEGVPIADVFRSISALYFRGKLEYATVFGTPHVHAAAVQIIVPGSGLCRPGEPFDLEALRQAAHVQVRPDDERYTAPLRADATRLAAALPSRAEVVLLGSIATHKYLPLLAEPLGERLRVPRELIGLGMMQRGSLLRRRAASGSELTYVRPGL